MDRLVELKRSGEDDPDFGREISEKNVPRRSRLDDQDTTPVEGQPARSDVAADNPLFAPPFVGHAGWPRASRSTTSPST